MVAVAKLTPSSCAYAQNQSEFLRPRAEIERIIAASRNAMPVFIGCAVCRSSGAIAVGFDFRGLKQQHEIVGTITWEWFLGPSQEAAKSMFARAVLGDPVGPQLLDLDPAKTPTELVAVSQYLPTGEANLPVLGVFSAFSATVRLLTPRERSIAKLWQYHITEIADALDISPRTVTAARSSIARRLNREGPMLDAMLVMLRDVL